MAIREMPEDYPNNSDAAKSRATKQQEKRPTKVAKGPVKKRKKPLTKRIAQAFGAAEGQGVLEYILHDIIIPATQNMIADSISNGVDMAIFGEVRNRQRGGRYRAESRTRYDRVSWRDDDRDRLSRRDYRDEITPRRSALYDYEEIIFDRKEDVEAVISGLIEIVDTHGETTVGDLYDLAGVKAPDYTVDNYGWTNLAHASYRHIRDGYVLDLPRPRLL